MEIESTLQPTRIRVVGVGGAGCNAVNRMIGANIQSVDFVAVNTDKQSLDMSRAKTKIQIGVDSTRGLGAGANPEVGKKAAEEQAGLIQKCLKGSDMIFITAGMGGGTGTGASPVVAKIAKETGALTVAVVTKPFHFEMASRMEQAEMGIENLRSAVDTLIVIENEKLLNLKSAKLSIDQAFGEADQVLLEGVRGVSNLILNSGYINVDFADVETIMKDKGNAIMSMALVNVDDGKKEIVSKVLENPIVEGTTIRGAKGMLINVNYGKEIGINQVAGVIQLIIAQASPNAKCIQGLTPDKTLNDDQMMVTVIATDFQNDNYPSSIHPVEGEGFRDEEHSRRFMRDSGDDEDFDDTISPNGAPRRDFFGHEDSSALDNIAQRKKVSNPKSPANPKNPAKREEQFVAKGQLSDLFADNGEYAGIEKDFLGDANDFANPNNPNGFANPNNHSSFSENDFENKFEGASSRNDSTAHNKDKSHQEKEAIYTLAANPNKKRQDSLSESSKLGLGEAWEQNEASFDGNIDLEKPAYLRMGKKLSL